jgi:hypothetical protein
MNQSPSLSIGRRTAVAIVLAGVVVAGSVAAAAALSGRAATGTPAPSSPPAASPIATPAPTPVPTPTPVASPTPVPTPTPVPSDDPRPAPSDPPINGGSDGSPNRLDLENATGADVWVDIQDGSGTLEGAWSGQPGDGVSVDSYTLEIDNIDAHTLKLTWSDYPIDNELTLLISEDLSHIVLVQPEPKGDTDAMAFDRELILEFSEPVSADEIVAILQDGLDTAG